MSAYRDRLAGLYQELDQYIYDFESYNSDEEDNEEEDENMFDEEDDDDDDDNMNDEGDDEENMNDEEDEQEEEEENQEEKRREGQDDEEEDMQVDNKVSDDDEASFPTLKKEEEKKKKKGKPEKSKLVSLLAQIANTIRDATRDSSFTDSDSAELVAEADAKFSQAMVFAYNTDNYGPYAESHVPSFAHDDDAQEACGNEEGKKKSAPLLKDASELDGEYQFASTFLPHIASFFHFFGDMIDRTKFKAPSVPLTWKTTFKPHPLSSPCARFRDEVADIDPSTAWGLDPDSETDISSSHPLATAVFQARLEVKSTDTPNPCEMQLSRPSGDTLVLTSQGGYKSRVPYASFYHPNNPANANHDGMRGRRIRLDLTSQAREMALHEPSTATGEGGAADNTLVFVGDWERIKSYRCLPANGGEGMNRRVHTLASEGFGGPIAVLPSSSSSSATGERVVRCGKDGKVAVWDLSALPVHTVDASGKHSVIGKVIPVDELNTWRDDPELIERSTGSLPTSFVKLSLGDEYAHSKGTGDCEIGVWHAHPNRAGTMLTGGGLYTRNENYFCHAFDLERGGGPVMRYLGHGGIVEGFSTSVGYVTSDTTTTDGDANVFLTWASDGHVRLYDTRVVLPVMTIVAAAGSMLAPVAAAALAHPSGIPFVFTSAHQSECVKVWDVRAQRSVYELATGNNSVSDLAWDARTGTLFASTECEHRDLNMPGGGYRVAKIPRMRVYPADAAHDGEEGVVDDDEEEEEEEEEEEGKADEEEEYDPPDPYKCWPRRAVHQENYFGHVFDSGTHRIFQYKFKLDPDGTFLPGYGDATATRRDDGFGSGIMY